MTSAAAGSTRIPYKHSTTTLPHQSPRYATSPSHAFKEPDVIVVEKGVAPSRRSADTSVDKVDSKAKTATSSVKSLRTHSRLASLGRLRPRGSVQKQQQQPASQGETISTQVPVSPSDAGSSQKLSDTSTLSNTNSETSLSEDAKSDSKSVKERRSRPSFWLSSSNVPSESTKYIDEVSQYERLVQHRPRMMHQTSSKLLRMTDDERPFTRVRVDLFS